jgi:hypothetical protein
MSFLPTYCYVASIRSLVYSMIQPRYMPYNYPALVRSMKDKITNDFTNNFDNLCRFTFNFQNNLFENIIMDFLVEIPFERFFVMLYICFKEHCTPDLLKRVQKTFWEFCYHLPTLRQMIEDDGYIGDYTNMFKIQYQTNNEYIWNVIDKLPREYITDFLLFNHDLPNLQRFLTSEEINEQLFERTILFPTDKKVEYQQVAHWIGKQVEFTKVGNYHFMFLVSLSLEDILNASKIYSRYKFELTKEMLAVMGKHGSKQGFKFIFKRIKNVDKKIYISFTANQACIRNQTEFVRWLIDNYTTYEIHITNIVIKEMIKERHFECLKVVKNSISKFHHNIICDYGNDEFLRWYFVNFDILEKPKQLGAGFVWEKVKEENMRNYYQKMFKTMWDQKLPVAEWMIKPQVMKYLV